MFENSLIVSVGIGAAVGGPSREYLEALCENPLQVNAMLAQLEMEKAQRGNDDG